MKVVEAYHGVVRTGLALVSLLLMATACSDRAATQLVSTALETATAPAAQITPASTPLLGPPPECPSAIEWSQALEHIGERVTVWGPIVDTHYAPEERGRPTFLNLGRAYPSPDRFTALIWIGDRDEFPEPPEALYRYATACVSGEVEVYRDGDGSAEIIVSDPAQIVVTQRPHPGQTLVMWPGATWTAQDVDWTETEFYLGCQGTLDATGGAEVSERRWGHFYCAPQTRSGVSPPRFPLCARTGRTLTTAAGTGAEFICWSLIESTPLVVHTGGDEPQTLEMIPGAPWTAEDVDWATSSLQRSCTTDPLREPRFYCAPDRPPGVAGGVPSFPYCVGTGRTTTNASGTGPEYLCFWFADGRLWGSFDSD